MNAHGRLAVCLLFLALGVPAFGATKQWTGNGGNALWSNGANWQDNVPPGNGDDLVFTVGDAPTLSVTNDFPSITIHSISAVKRNVDTFIHGFVEVGGNPLAISGTLSNNVMLDVNVTLAASQSWIAAGYPAAAIVLEGTVDLNGYTLTAGGIKNGVNFDGDVVGTGALIAQGACDTGGVTFNGHVSINGPFTQVCGPVTFTNSNSFTGPLNLTSPTNNNFQAVYMTAPGAFPGCLVLFSDNSTVELRLGSNSLTQASLSGSGAIRLDGGSVTLTNAPNTTFHGFIYGPGSLHVSGGNQTLSLGDGMTTTVSNNATLFVDGANQVSSGTTTVGPGTLQLRNAKMRTINASGGALSLLQNNSATDVTLSSGSNFIVPLGTGQINISGNIALGSSVLTLIPEAQPQTGATYRIIWNQGSGSTAGTFAGHPEGSSFTLNGWVYSITYHSGSGNDVVITVVGPAALATQTTLSTSPNPSHYHQPVTLRAVVQSASAVPAGMVVFTDNGSPLGGAPLDANGVATLTTSAFTPGPHPIVATYQGNATFSGSSSSVDMQTVLPDCPFPILTSTLSDVTVTPHSDVTLSVTTASGQQEQFAWFSGTYPDDSQPLGVTSPALTLQNVENSERVWVRVTNGCGSVDAAAMVAVHTPPKRRSVSH